MENIEKNLQGGAVQMAMPEEKKVQENQETDLVTYGENGEIIDCKFERVDLSKPATILTYCDDIKAKISNLLDSTAQMAAANPNVVLDEAMISSIAAFDASLDEREEAKKRAEQQPEAIKKLKGLFSRFGFKKAQEEEVKLTYQGRYEQYCDGIRKVVEAVEAQMQGSMNDIKLRDAIAEEMIPLVEVLEVMLQVGKIDKETFDRETVKLIAVAKTADDEREIQYRQQTSDVFNSKLNELEKSLIIYKEQIQSYRIQQKTDMELVLQNKSFISDQAPILKAQGSVMVFNRQQRERIDVMQKLNNATNQAIQNNAKEVQQNVQDVVNLSVNSGISAETLKQLSDALARGVELFKQGAKQKQVKIESDRKVLTQLGETLDAYKREVLQLVDDDGVIAALLNENQNSEPQIAPQKRRGTK